MELVIHVSDIHLLLERFDNIIPVLSGSWCLAVKHSDQQIVHYACQSVSIVVVTFEQNQPFHGRLSQGSTPYFHLVALL